MIPSRGRRHKGAFFYPLMQYSQLMPAETEDELVERVEKKLRGATFTQTRQRVYLEDGTFEDVPGPLVPLDPPTETREESELIDAVEKKLSGPSLGEAMASAIRGDLSRDSMARRIFGIEKLEPPKE
jgi:hypothetical protein